MNISFDKAQCDLMWFFRADNIYKENPRVIVYKFARVLFGMSVSSFLSDASLAYHIKQNFTENEEITDKVRHNFHINDWTCR